MPFGSDRRGVGVWDGWICEMFGAAGPEGGIAART
jgi:hypothetical protein